MTKYPVILIFIENHLKQQKTLLFQNFLMKWWWDHDKQVITTLVSHFESMLIIEKKIQIILEKILTVGQWNIGHNIVQHCPAWSSRTVFKDRWFCPPQGTFGDIWKHFYCHGLGWDRLTKIDSLLEQTLIRLLWALFSTRSLPWHPCPWPDESSYQRILLRQFIESLSLSTLDIWSDSSSLTLDI